MSKIADTQAGRTDGGYGRLFSVAALGSLCSRVHATTIVAGSELETLLGSGRYCRVLDSNETAVFLAGRLPHDAFLIPKPSLRKVVSPRIGFVGAEPDFVLVIGRDVYALEVKDGDSFDTKKAQAETLAVRNYSRLLNSALGPAYICYPRICFFNATRNEDIVTGFRGAVSLDETLTGEQLCNLIGASYDGIAEFRGRDRETNTRFFVSQLLTIPEIKEEIVRARIESVTREREK